MSKWFADTRVEWIKETAEIFGFINREHIMRKFNVSPAQAAADIATTLRRWPGLLTYNPSSKRYEAKQ